MSFQFLAIRQQINLIRSNIDSMKALVNEQKFHYKDKSIYEQSKVLIQVLMMTL